MAVIPIRKPRVEVRAAIPTNQLYRAVLDALAAWSDQQADSFAGDAVYALSREDLIALARQYVELIELPSA
jgi:hypothetical protein